MSANPKDFLADVTRLDPASVQPFSGSRKIYVQGTRPDLRVPMREIRQSPTLTSGAPEENPPITVYDTSGPYSDPEAAIDLKQGLSPLRAAWILERADTEELADFSSEYGRARKDDPALAELRFAHIRKPRKALAGRNVSQMHYARQGMVTPEMEYIAIRENLRLDELRADHTIYSNSSSMLEVTAELPMLVLIFTRKLRPMIMGSSSGWLMLAGMMARPAATSARTNSGVICSGMLAPQCWPGCCFNNFL